MSKETISPKQATKMIVVLLIGSATLFIMGLEAKMDIWIAILVAISISTLIYCIYARILSILPQLDFFETLETLLGRPITVIIISILTLFAFNFGGMVLTNYNNFIFTVGLTETPRVVISISIMLVCVIAVKSGVEALGRWSQIFVIVIVGFILLIIPLMITEANFTNIKPILHNGLKPIFKGALGVIAFPLADVFVFLLVFPAFKKGVSRYKIYLKGLYIAGALLFIISTLNVMILSPSFAEIVSFPTYLVLSIVKIGDFLNRLEVIAAAVFCMAVFFKISIFLSATCKGISYVFKVQNYRLLIFPIALMMVNYTVFSFNSVQEFQEWSFKVWPYYTLTFSAVLPLIVLILLEIKSRTSKNNNQLVIQEDS